MDLSLFFAGTAGSVPTARRGLPATLLRRGGDRLLFDCGEGTQRQLLKTVGLPEVGAVFLTHLHADHWFGLPGMLKSWIRAVDGRWIGIVDFSISDNTGKHITRATGVPVPAEALTELVMPPRR